MRSSRWRLTPAPGIRWFSGTASSTNTSPSVPAGKTKTARFASRSSEFQHASAVVNHIDLAGDILSKRTDATAAREQLRACPVSGRALDQLPDRAAAVVAEDVCARQAGNRAALIHVTPDHGVAFGVVVFRDRQDQSRLVASGRGLVAVHALHHIPAKIAAALQYVDLFVFVLTDIAAKQPTRATFE